MRLDLSDLSLQDIDKEESEQDKGIVTTTLNSAKWLWNHIYIYIYIASNAEDNIWRTFGCVRCNNETHDTVLLNCTTKGVGRTLP